MMQLRSQIKREDPEDVVQQDEEDDHCIPHPATPLPDPAKHPSLYPDNTATTTAKTKAVFNETIDLEVTVDKVDLDLTLQSLASNLPLESSSVVDESLDVLTAPQVYEWYASSLSVL